ncbi:MFS transporter [Carnobacterium divergens]|uniref:MFS transporter n=1 Tax=Carnobacterium divergens TaxID=2748 RepID=UPI0007F5142A|nr:MFS transporter [Carnobacterium divergens]SBO17137.1 putative efflux transporter [Carnobacterium divergens]
MNIIKNNNYYKLVGGKFLSVIGTFVQSTAFSLYIIDTLNDSLIFATILMSALIPRIVLGPLGGVFVDWFDRKRLLVGIDIASGLLLVSTAVLFGNNLSLPVVYFICIGLGILNSIDDPLVMSLIPELVEEKDLANANSINMFSSAIGNIIGPILGVLVYTNFGIESVLYFNGISFLLGAFLEAAMKVKKNSIVTQKNFSSFKNDFKDGLNYIFSNKLIFLIMSSIFIQNCFFNGATTVGIPYVARQVLKIGDGQFAILEIILIVGTILGLVISPKISGNYPLVKVFPKLLLGISGCFLLIGLICLLLGNSQQISFYLILVVYTVLGALSINVNISFQTEMQKIVDSEMFGRVSSLILSLIMASIPLGQLLYGYLFRVMQPSLPFLLTFSVIVVVATVFSLVAKNNSFFVSKN